jgi:hypothetical protein
MHTSTIRLVEEGDPSVVIQTAWKRKFPKYRDSRYRKNKGGRLLSIVNKQ